MKKRASLFSHVLLQASSILLIIKRGELVVQGQISLNSPSGLSRFRHESNEYCNPPTSQIVVVFILKSENLFI